MNIPSIHLCKYNNPPFISRRSSHCTHFCQQRHSFLLSLFSMLNLFVSVVNKPIPSIYPFHPPTSPFTKRHAWKNCREIGFIAVKREATKKKTSVGKSLSGCNKPNCTRLVQELFGLLGSEASSLFPNNLAKR